jgi:hypothetical protein
MDPTACFYAFVGACEDGDYEAAADAQECYEEWTAKGGVKAEDADGGIVIKLDIEQDRYLVIEDGGLERWRKAVRNVRV